jgi:hypothetical protein
MALIGDGGSDEAAAVVDDPGADQANSMVRCSPPASKQLGNLDLACRVKADLVFATSCGRQTISFATSAG